VNPVTPEMDEEAAQEPAHSSVLAGSIPERVMQRAAGTGVVTRVAIFIGIVLVALAVASPIIGIAGSNPLSAYSALLRGSVGSKRGIAESLQSATPLLVGGLAVSVAFQAGLFNIGVEGQLVIGGLVAGAVGAKLNLPPVVHLVVALLAAAVAGSLWALIPALLKAFRGVHEVITTIMLNYIAFSLSTYLVSPGGLSRRRPTRCARMHYCQRSGSRPVCTPACSSRSHCAWAAGGCCIGCRPVTDCGWSA
jgi:ABC-type uncharacterized transport system permease subunit